MSKKEYKQKNIEYFNVRSQEEDMHKLPEGILYKVIRKGSGTKSPNIRSIVCVNYAGRFIDGTEFDSSYTQGYPVAFRLSDLISGWKIALSHMHAGDKWEVVIPAELGYGSRANGEIPGNSTLVFEIELVSIA
jgi:peptidylprolyl isomerase